MELAPLSYHFTELQKQFIDVIKQASTQPMRREGKKGEDEPVGKSIQTVVGIQLTPLEQKALMIIAKKQNELGSDMFPVKELTVNQTSSSLGSVH